MNLVIIGVPYAAHKHQAGIESAPSTWQAAGLLEQLAPLVARAVWVSLQSAAAGTEMEQLVAIACQLRETVATVHQAGAFPLVLGGDAELTALATVAGLQRAGKRPGVAWLGGHNSFAPAEPLALLAGRGESVLSREVGIKAIPEWQILLAGHRESSPETIAALDQSAATHWHAQDLGLAGASELGRDVADWPSVYLHLDLDVLSPAIMPAVDKPMPGGLSLETIIAGIESIAAAGRIDAMGISGYNPDHDGDGLGQETSLRAIGAAVRILGI